MESAMDYFRGLVTGLVVGALAMFVFDPKQGRRRRALARHRVLHYGSDVAEWRASRQRAIARRP
jgi:gas vesicle protein